jgi:DNA-binding transcriptional LysR family regulator
LTHAAQILVEHTERILAELESAQASVAHLAGRVGGVIRLGAFPTAASSLVPAALAACRISHPDLTIRLEEWEPDHGIPALKAGRLDMALVYEFNLLPAVADPGVQLIPLVTEPLLAAVPQDLALAPGRLRLASLRHQSWIAPGSDSALRATLERACGLSGFAPRLDYTSNDYTVILALVRAGLGTSLIPRLASERIASGVRLRRLTEPELTRTVSVAVRAGAAATPAVAALTSALRDTSTPFTASTGRRTRRGERRPPITRGSRRRE